MTWIFMLIALFAAHFLLDYAGQGDFMAKAKSQCNPIQGVPWQQVMLAHAFMHGAAVAFITGIWWLCIVETAIHFATDNAKCRGMIGYNTDQFIHLACKVIYIIFIFAL